MKKISMTASAVALGLACAMPVMAQDSGTSASSGSSTLSSQPADSSTLSSQPSTMSSQPSDTSSSQTAAMGAGPEEIEVDNDRDMGWIGLLGLAGLLGLRRRRHHDDPHDRVRSAPMR